jgi:hypothetical protein
VVASCHQKRFARIAAAQQHAREQDGINADGGQQQSFVNNNNDTTKVSEQPNLKSSFGSSLEQNERVQLLRKRSSSFEHTITDSTLLTTPDPDITHVAMTPQEQQTLEHEMRVQHLHPLSMRLEAEEAEQRLQNQRDYYTRQYQTSSTSNTTRGSVRGGGPQRDGYYTGGRDRDWNRIVDAFHSNPRNGTVQRLDDLVVLKAAMMLTMEEESRRRGGEPPPEQQQSNTPNAASALN